MLLKKGFTLIELLIVISIIALLSIAAFVNFKDLVQDQIIKKAIGEIQTALRLAQANATSSFLCNGQASVDWKVNIRVDRVNVDLMCGDSDFIVKTTTLQNVQVESIEGSACTSPITTFTDLLLKITYTKLSGSVKIDGPADCLDNSPKVLVNIKNTKTDNIKTFTISKGGAIDVE